MKSCSISEYTYFSKRLNREKLSLMTIIEIIETTVIINIFMCAHWMSLSKIALFLYPNFSFLRTSYHFQLSCRWEATFWCQNLFRRWLSGQNRKIDIASSRWRFRGDGKRRFNYYSWMGWYWSKTRWRFRGHYLSRNRSHTGLLSLLGG